MLRARVGGACDGRLLHVVSGIGVIILRMVGVFGSRSVIAGRVGLADHLVMARGFLMVFGRLRLRIDMVAQGSAFGATGVGGPSVQ